MIWKNVLCRFSFLWFALCSWQRDKIFCHRFYALHQHEQEGIPWKRTNEFLKERKRQTNKFLDFSVKYAAERAAFVCIKPRGEEREREREPGFYCIPQGDRILCIKLICLRTRAIEILLRAFPLMKLICEPFWNCLNINVGIFSLREHTLTFAKRIIDSPNFGKKFNNFNQLATRHQRSFSV